MHILGYHTKKNEWKCQDVHKKKLACSIEEDTFFFYSIIKRVQKLQWKHLPNQFLDAHQKSQETLRNGTA